jgi:2-polyprenyl-3-methyl-5-hydroxy-6-metoxy-1,4-benzoquinol methylase
MKKLDKYVLRPESVVTGKKNLELLHSFKDFPVFFGCVDSPAEEDLCADMDWAIDPESGVVQLTKMVPLDILYQSQHVDGCSPTWQRYYQDFGEYIITTKPKSVLEIGGGQGDLAEIVTKGSKGTHWTIVEPNPLHPGNDRISIVRAFFDEGFKCPGEFDMVVFSQVMEHSYDPQAFVRAIAGFLKPGSRLVFAYPDLELWLKRKYTNALNFEHTMFLTDHFVEYFLRKYGFKISNKTAYKDHSFLYTAEKLEKAESSPSFDNKYTEYRKIFMDFIDFHEEMVAELNKKMKSTPTPVYLFGAHIFSEFLIQFGLRTEKIVSVLDNSKLKIGRRLYGTNFRVDSPKVLKGKGPVNLILKAGIYNDEIKKDILENVNKEVVFW